jgi:hypothetical protein
VGYATILSAIASIAVAGGETYRGLNRLTIVGIYLVGGILGGCLFWFLQTFCGSPWGRAAIGFACLLPMMGLGLLLADLDASLTARVVGAVASAAFVGGGIGLSVGDP